MSRGDGRKARCLMNAYSFIFVPIIEGEGTGVKAKVFSAGKKDVPDRGQILVGRWLERLDFRSCCETTPVFLMRLLAPLLPFWPFR